MKKKRKIEIAVAIPTFNRLEKLKAAIASIERQRFDDSRIKLICCLANSASYDGTAEYIKSLKKSSLTFISFNKLVLSGEEVFKDSGHHNRIQLAEIIPKTVDWVWFLGDDDYFVHDQVISSLAEVIERSEDLDPSLIHISQARRSRRTGQVIHGRLIELCNSLGFHEMLGWMSSLVMKTEVFKNYPGLASRYPNSAYGHSAVFLELCASKSALFVDVAWVDTQDEVQTEESIQRWALENMGERYFYVVDGILLQFEEGIIQQRLKPAFYRYHTYSLWDRYANFLVVRALNTGKLTAEDLQHWDRIRKIADTLDDPVFAKLYLSWHSSLSSQIRDILKYQTLLIDARNGLAEYVNRLSGGCYPAYELLEPT